jgi:peptidoglycan/xylan/chitin deacetylase (PgdA/CDA1 family)
VLLPRCIYLTCHGLGEPPRTTDPAEHPFWLEVDVFGRALSTAAAVERRTGASVQFTFDDGNISDHRLAWPLLASCRRSAIFFVCGSRIGKPGYLAAEQLRELSEAGMTIGCHGYEHVSWRTFSDRQLTEQLARGRSSIEAAIGRPVDLASAPFGEFDRRVVRAVNAAGFTSLFTSSGGFATGDRGLVPRTTLKAGISPEQDLPRLARLSGRAWDSWYDRARRLKYWTS